MSPPPVPVPELTVQVNVAVPFAPVVSVAVTVTDDVPAVVGVPEISPVEELIDSPAGRPVAVYVRVCPDAESLAATWRLAAVPTVAVWPPGLVTVTVLVVVPPPAGEISMPLTWALSLTVTNWMEIVPLLLAVAVNGSSTALNSPPAVAKMSKLVRTWLPLMRTLKVRDPAVVQYSSAKSRRTL